MHGETVKKSTCLTLYVILIDPNFSDNELGKKESVIWGRFGRLRH